MNSRDLHVKSNFPGTWYCSMHIAPHFSFANRTGRDWYKAREVPEDSNSNLPIYLQQANSPNFNCKEAITINNSHGSSTGNHDQELDRQVLHGRFTLKLSADGNRPLT